MEFLLAWLIALSIFFEGTDYSNEEIRKSTDENHQLLYEHYGEEYMDVISGLDETEG